MTKSAKILATIKPLMLPLAMLLGITLHSYMGYLAFLSKYLIFLMLLITYCKVSISNFKFDGSMWWLLAIQTIGALAVYFLLLIFNRDIAEGVFICIYCPTATAAPVITGMLGGKVEKVAVYSLLSNFVVAVTAPLLLAYMTDYTDIRFGDSLLSIAMNVLPIILGPLALAALLRATVPSFHRAIATHQSISFYIWAVSLLIIVGGSVSFIMKEPADRIPEMIAIGILSLIACLGQFSLGRHIGKRYGDPVASAQSLGQKNTVLAVWLAMTYLNPIASVGPACYIAWHNTVNSWQLYHHKKSETYQKGISER